MGDGVEHSRVIHIEDGVVTAVAQGTEEEAGTSVAILLDSTTARGLLSGVLNGTEATRAIRIEERIGDEVHRMLSPPLDLASRPEFDELPRLQGASLTVEYKTRSGPFGDVVHWEEFTDGRCTKRELGPHADPDVKIGMSFANLLRLKRGEIGVLDVLDPGAVEGSWAKLSLLAGLVESDEYQRALLASGAGPMTPALAALVEVSGTQSYRQVLADLVELAAPTPHVA